MPVIKRRVSKVEDRPTFEPYDGPEPMPGFYRGKITTMKTAVASTDREGFLVVVELKASDPKGNLAKYDGFPAFVRLWLSDDPSHDNSLRAREATFYRAVLGKDKLPEDLNINVESTEPGAKVKTIAGINPVGREVIVELKRGMYDGVPRIEADGIMRVKAKAEPVEDESSDDDEVEMVEVEYEEPAEDEDDLEEEEGEEVGEDYTEEELEAMTVKEVRDIAREDFGLEIPGLKKAQIISAILAEQAGDEEAEEGFTRDELEGYAIKEIKGVAKELGITISAGAKKDDLIDEIIDAQADQAEDEEEEDDDEYGVARDELAELDRNALKAIIREEIEGAKILKSQTDDDLRSVILTARFPGVDPEEAPF